MNICILSLWCVLLFCCAAFPEGNISSNCMIYYHDFISVQSHHFSYNYMRPLTATVLCYSWFRGMLILFLSLWETGITGDLHAEASDLVSGVIINMTNLNTLGEKILIVNQGQLHFVSTMVIWSQIILCWEESPVVCRLLGSSMTFNPRHPDTSISLMLVTTKHTPRHCQMSPGGVVVVVQNPPGWNSQS